MGRIVVLASGGINSTVAAIRAKQGDNSVHLLHVDYGQKPADPQKAAVRMIADNLGGEFTSIEMPHVGKIAALHRPVGPGIHASDAKRAYPIDSVSQVPTLITTLLGAGVQLAHRVAASSVHIGTSELADEIETEASPGRGTPDHRRDVFYLFNLLLEQLQRSKCPIKLETPLIDLTRADIVKLGARYNAPFELTFSCQSEREARCGSCASCMARTKAFKQADVIDPATMVSAK